MCTYIYNVHVRVVANCPTCITSCAHFLLSLLHFKAHVLIAPQTHSNVNV